MGEGEPWDYRNTGWGHKPRGRSKEEFESALGPRMESVGEGRIGMIQIP